jgi:protein-tyrosine phosphatase
MTARALQWAEPPISRVMFLCTANYYRSRFCEEVFNHHAAAQRLSWHAYSRALRDAPATLNPGPMSDFAIDFLRKRGIRPIGHWRLPLAATRFDFEMNRLIVAVNEPEHRPMVEAKWRALSHRVDYWAVADVDELAPDTALGQLEDRVTRLIRRLAARAPSARRP